MPVFHASRSCTSDAAFRGSVQRLQTGLVVLCKRVSVDGGLEDFERELHALFTQAEREVLAEGLERFDVDVPYVLIDGRKHCRVLRASRDLHLGSGAGYGEAHAVSGRQGQGGGAVGASRRYGRGALDAARGAPGELSRDAPDAARV